jgi:hypothetical protein
MEAAKKSYLIDANQFRALMQQKDNTIPKKMKHVAAKKKIASKQKYFTYSELYNKYINDNALKRRPLEIVEHNEPVIETNIVSKSPLRKIKLLPKTQVDRGMLIYSKLKNSNDLKWDNHGVYLYKKQLGNVDISDYIQLYVSRRKNINVDGFPEFKAYVDNLLTAKEEVDKPEPQSGEGVDTWLRYSFN